MNVQVVKHDGQASTWIHVHEHLDVLFEQVLVDGSLVDRNCFNPSLTRDGCNHCYKACSVLVEADFDVLVGSRVVLGCTRLFGEHDFVSPTLLSFGLLGE